jgi:hypothetical protein
MDLAGQQQKWQEVISLADEAQQKGYSPAVASEWLPLINAYIQSGSGDKALAASREAFKTDPLVSARLCTAWAKAGSGLDEAAKTAKEELNCRN